MPATKNQNVDAVVTARYSEASQRRVEALCCPTSYDPALLAAIPAEVVERDYGCGDPSAYLEPGETVVDLGSGSGKICFIASQVVGPEGAVIGVDMNDDMLAVAERAAPEVAAAIGYGNVEFRRGRIQDMRPIVDDEAADVVVSNCVLNLVDPGDKKQLFREIHRVLAPTGRAIISDIVASREVPASMQADPDLWSGCISGAFEEEAFTRAFEDAGFHGVAVIERQDEPWQIVEGIEFRSVTVAAYKTARAARDHAVDGPSASSGCCPPPAEPNAKKSPCC